MYFGWDFILPPKERHVFSNCDFSVLRSRKDVSSNQGCFFFDGTAPINQLTGSFFKGYQVEKKINPWRLNEKLISNTFQELNQHFLKVNLSIEKKTFQISNT